MPVVMEALSSVVPPPHKLWTRGECEALARVGLLDTSGFELVQGELILKMGKLMPHTRSVVWLLSVFQRIFGASFVAPETSIDLHPDDIPTSEPEPDVIVLTTSFEKIALRPRPDQIRLAAEVSSTTLSFDLTVKAGLYARAGIPEYWVLDLTGGRLIVHRRPESGRYAEVFAYGREESVATLAAPEAMIRVGELL